MSDKAFWLVRVEIWEPNVHVRRLARRPFFVWAEVDYDIEINFSDTRFPVRGGEYHIQEAPDRTVLWATDPRGTRGVAGLATTRVYARDEGLWEAGMAAWVIPSWAGAE